MIGQFCFFVESYRKQFCFWSNFMKSNFVYDWNLLCTLSIENRCWSNSTFDIFYGKSLLIEKTTSNELPYHIIFRVSIFDANSVWSNMKKCALRFWSKRVILWKVFGFLRSFLIDIDERRSCFKKETKKKLST